MGVHATTHINAPWHYSPTVNGHKAKTIYEILLEWCFGEGLVIDMKHKADFNAIAIQGIEHFLKTEKLALSKGMIVLIKTGRNKFNDTKDWKT